MPINVELKAKVENFESLTEKLKTLSHSQIIQEDFYINVGEGKLKLRKSNINKPQVIFYERSNVFDAKESHYKIHTFKTQEKFSHAYKNFRKNFQDRRSSGCDRIQKTGHHY